MRRRAPGRRVRPGSALNPRTKIIFAGVMTLALCIAVAVYVALGVRSFLLDSPVFTIDTLYVMSADEQPIVNAEEIINVERLGENRHLLRYDVKKLMRDIQARHPELATVVVRKQFPSALIITIRKRIPVVIVGNNLCVVDKEGFALPFNQEYALLPKISGIHSAQVPLAAKSGSLRLEKALALLIALEEAGIYPARKVSRIDVGDFSQVLFYFDDNTEVKMGGDEFAQKAKVLKGILQRLKKEKDLTPKYIDMRFGNPAVLPQEK
ncbi:MAG: cell division protein FtsQ/DivIB [Candidatus Omnitrophota bacterium]